jgi:hypothetical protein
MEPAAMQATPSSCLFSNWIASRKVSKSTAYAWRSALKIESQRRRVAGWVETWLSAEPAADSYLLPGINQYLSITGEDTATIRESERLWHKPNWCDITMCLAY